MSNLQIFKFDEKEIRTIERDGKPFFLAKDVTDILGYRDSADAIKRHCKCAILLNSGESPELTTSSYGATIIPEMDVYRLMMKSKLPSAERFEEWVVGDVLPSIRKTGKYEVAKFDVPEDYPSALRLAADLFEKVEVQSIELNKQSTRLTEQAPKVAAFNTFISSKDCVTVNQLSKVLGKEFKMGEKRLFKILREKGILNKDNVPYQKYIDSGHFALGESTFTIGRTVKLRLTARATTKGQDMCRANLLSGKWDIV